MRRKAITLLTGYLMVWSIGLAQTNTFPSSGNVGIGTTHPALKLEVVGNSYIDEYLDIGSKRDNTLNAPSGLWIDDPGETYTSIQLVEEGWSGSHAILFNSYKSLNTVDGGIATIGNTKYSNDAGNYSSGAGMIAFYGNPHEMGFYISPKSTGADQNVEWGTPIMWLQQNGNVGIGTTDPTAKLAIDGTTKAKEVIVTDQPSDWPDYVFQQDYQMLNVRELEAFIKEYQHLPGIPTKDEVSRDGQNLGVIQSKLLEKVEELTLHIIEQQKLIQQQRKHLDQLRTEHLSRIQALETEIKKLIR